MGFSLSYTMVTKADKEEIVMVTLGIGGEGFEGSFRVSKLADAQVPYVNGHCVFRAPTCILQYALNHPQLLTTLNIMSSAMWRVVMSCCLGNNDKAKIAPHQH